MNIDNTQRIYNVSLNEAQWIFSNGYWIEWVNGGYDGDYAIIDNDQYHEVIKLRKWWKWKEKAKSFKQIRFIDLEDKN